MSPKGRTSDSQVDLRQGTLDLLILRASHSHFSRI
jgi:hypothetical protein